MANLVSMIVGGLAIPLGIAWVIWPEKMRALQTKLLYFGYVESDHDPTDTEVLVGRIGGGVLAVLGATLLFGIFP